MEPRILFVLIPVESDTQEKSDKVQTKAPNQNYRENWDRIFLQAPNNSIN